MMDPALTAMLTQTVALAVATSVSASGEPVWGTPTTGIPARVDAEQQLISGAGGQQVTTSHRIYINGDASPVPVVSGRIWLPGTSGDASARQIHRVDTLYGLDGSTVDHYEVAI